MSQFDDSPPRHHPQSSSRQSLYTSPPDVSANSFVAAPSTIARIGSPSSLFGRDDPFFGSSNNPHIDDDDKHNNNDDDDTATAGPWAGATSPRIPPHRTPNPHTHTHPTHTHTPHHTRGAEKDVRDLLTATNARIPPAYYVVHAQLVREYGDGADDDGMVEAHGAADRVLTEAATAAGPLSPVGDLRGKIWEAVVGHKDLIGRGEVWCLLALVAVVQEGYGSGAGVGGVGGVGVGVDELLEVVNARRHGMLSPPLPSSPLPLLPSHGLVRGR